MREPDPYDPGPHRSDDAPKMPRVRDRAGELKPPPTGHAAKAALERLDDRFACQACGKTCAPDDPDAPPLPIRPAWRTGAVLHYPCPCGGKAEATTRDLVMWLRMDRTGRGFVALRNLDAAVEKAKEAQQKALAAGEFAAAAANGALVARIEEANLKMAGVFAETVEVTHRFAPAEDDPEVEEQLSKWWKRGEKVIDVEVTPPKDPA